MFTLKITHFHLDFHKRKAYNIYRVVWSSLMRNNIYIYLVEVGKYPLSLSVGTEIDSRLSLKLVGMQAFSTLSCNLLKIKELSKLKGCFKSMLCHFEKVFRLFKERRGIDI